MFLRVPFKSCTYIVDWLWQWIRVIQNWNIFGTHFESGFIVFKSTLHPWFDTLGESALRQILADSRKVADRVNEPYARNIRGAVDELTQLTDRLAELRAKGLVRALFFH